MNGRLGVVALLLGVGLSRADEPASIDLDVGQTLDVCKAQLTVCPIGTFMCDDPKIAIVVDGSEGPLLKGVSPGMTLCAVSGPGGSFRRVIHVTVRVP